MTLARSYTATEAVASGVVDFIAQDVQDLLVQLDGQSVSTASGTVTLDTTDIALRELKLTVLETFLNFAANPNLAFALLVIGALAILIDILLIGSVGLGVVGGVNMLVGMAGMGQLPVNVVGAGLLVLFIVLLYFELQHSGFGVLGAGAIGALALGGLFLFGNLFTTPDIPEPSFRVSVWMIGVISGVMAVTLAFFVQLIRKDTGQSAAYVTADEGEIVGQWGVAVTALEPSGKVWVADKEWTATTETSQMIDEGEEIQVLGAYGDVLRVAKMYEESD